MTRDTAEADATLDAYDAGRAMAIQEAQTLLRYLSERRTAGIVGESMRVALEEAAKAIECIGWDRHRVAAEAKKLGGASNGS